MLVVSLVLLSDCEPHCEHNECAVLNGSLYSECGDCATDHACHRGAHGFRKETPRREGAPRTSILCAPSETQCNGPRTLAAAVGAGLQRHANSTLYYDFGPHLIGAGGVVNLPPRGQDAALTGQRIEQAAESIVRGIGALAGGEHGLVVVYGAQQGAQYLFIYVACILGGLDALFLPAYHDLEQVLAQLHERGRFVLFAPLIHASSACRRYHLHLAVSLAGASPTCARRQDGSGPPRSGSRVQGPGPPQSRSTSWAKLLEAGGEERSGEERSGEEKSGEQARPRNPLTPRWWRNSKPDLSPGSSRSRSPEMLVPRLTYLRT